MTDTKAQLTMTSGPVPGSSIFLEKPEIYLGRDLANDLPIPDAEISRRHARIFQQSDMVFIEDLGSTNGTFVNGARITSPKQLHNGDQITLAEKTVFAISLPGAAVPVSATPESLHNTQPHPVAQPQPEVFQPVVQPVPERELAPEPGFTKQPKKMSGFLIFLLILVAIIALTVLVLVFMPASWWCAITFNGLNGCPVQ